MEAREREQVRAHLEQCDACRGEAAFRLKVTAASREQGAAWLQVMGPLVAAVGVATVEHPRRDPAWDLTLATPTSPGILLLARTTVVFVYDGLAALAVTVGTCSLEPPRPDGAGLAGSHGAAARACKGAAGPR